MSLAEELHVKPRCDDDRSGRELAEQLRDRREAVRIVEEPEHEDHRAAADDAEQLFRRIDRSDQ